MIALHTLYLETIGAMVAAENLTVAVQDLTTDQGNAGRLYLMAQDSTAAVAVITFGFAQEGARFEIRTRDERHAVVDVRYVEGIEPFLREARKTLRAGRLGAPRKVTPTTVVGAFGNGDDDDQAAA